MSSSESEYGFWNPKPRPDGMCPGCGSGGGLVPDHRPHEFVRGPQGPNEDLAQCGSCWVPCFALRPEGETYGDHLPDCSLPLRHLSYCEPGGSGHPKSRHERGYFPVASGGSGE